MAEEKRNCKDNCVPLSEVKEALEGSNTKSTWLFRLCTIAIIISVGVPAMLLGKLSAGDIKDERQDTRIEFMESQHTQLLKKMESLHEKNDVMKDAIIKKLNELQISIETHDHE